MISTFDQAIIDLQDFNKTELTVPEVWFLLGASKGLGLAFAELVHRQLPLVVPILVSRSIGRYINPSFESICLQQDFTKVDLWPEYIEAYRRCLQGIEGDANPRLRFFYFAGGGPYGPFSSKEFKDHQWAMRLNFEYPAYLLHHLLSDPDDIPGLKQIVFIGSSVAENRADPNAASYSAAKHALRGLVESVVSELNQSKSSLDVRLFSPGYMNTSLLPAQAWPRKIKGLVLEPALVAATLLEWSLSSRSLPESVSK